MLTFFSHFDYNLSVGVNVKLLYLLKWINRACQSLNGLIIIWECPTSNYFLYPNHRLISISTTARLGHYDCLLLYGTSPMTKVNSAVMGWTNHRMSSTGAINTVLHPGQMKADYWFIRKIYILSFTSITNTEIGKL